VKKKMETIEVRLPDPIIKELQRIAGLAGLPVETVMRVAIATEVSRHTPVEKSP
jgi:predicted DNA binding CopG/RHH family protein